MGARMVVLLAFVFGGVFLLIIPSPYKLVATIVWLLLVFASAAVLLRYHARNVIFTCSKCGHVFKISGIIDAITPHTGESKYLKCPECGVRGWCKATERG